MICGVVGLICSVIALACYVSLGNWNGAMWAGICSVWIANYLAAERGR